jgi:hypothetical protein
MVTPHISKHRVIQFVYGDIIPDHMVIAFALHDGWHLGVLSSRIHTLWTLAAGGTLEDRPIYYKSRCFDPFPFPDASEQQKSVIRDLAERLDAHRKAAQGRGVTITGMYNLLSKLRSGETFTAQERAQHEVAQTEILRQFHDELDAAVAAAYGWAVDMPESEVIFNLVALNKERAAEESRGLVRWLRPEYQASQQPAAAVSLLEVEHEAPVATSARIATRPWPRDLKEQLAALREVLLANDQLWSVESVAQAFRSRGRFRESIASHLDLLADLGMLTRVETAEGVRWHRPQARTA